MTTRKRGVYSRDQDETRYDHDVIGRRKSVVCTGTAFAENHLFKWGYNGRSELTTADRHQGTNPDSPGTQYSQFGDYEFGYDHIGNRRQSTTGTAAAQFYCATNLNQYSATDDAQTCTSPFTLF